MRKKRDQRDTQLIGLEREAAHTAFREGENAPSLSQQRLLALPELTLSREWECKKRGEVLGAKQLNILSFTLFWWEGLSKTILLSPSHSPIFLFL